MTDTDRNTRNQTETPLHERVRIASGQLRSGWDSQDRVRIENLLDHFAADERDSAVRGLVLVEIGLRQRYGESPQPAEYIDRFHQHRDVINDVFREVNRLSGTIAESAASAQAIETSTPGSGTKPTGREPTGIAVEQLPESIGRYRVIAALDRGGQATVFRAVHPDLGRDVVIKLCHAQSAIDSRSRERMREEGRILASLEHRNLARVYDFDSERDCPFLVIEFIRGLNLQQFVRQTTPNRKTCLEILKQVAAALAYVHRQGVLHLDLKPQNVLIDESGCPRLIDFGLAQSASGWDASSQIPDELAGTLAWMAPEQARGDGSGIGPQSDVYALGGLLYFLLTGHAPIEEESFRPLLDRAQRAAWDRSRLESAEMPVQLRTVCCRAMSSDPAERYATVDEMLADLTVAQRVAIFGPRRRGLLAGAVLLLVGSIGWFTMHDGDSSGSNAMTNPNAATVTGHVAAATRSTDTNPSVQSDVPLEMIDSTGDLSLRLWRDARYFDLVNSVPVTSGDRVRIHAKIPAGFYVSLLAFDSAGNMAQLVDAGPKSHAWDLSFPIDDNEAVPIVGRSGTECVFLCARPDRPIDLREIKAISPLQSPLPPLDDDSVLRIDSTGVSYLQRGRGFGAPVPTADPADTAQRRLERLHSALQTEYPLISGLAFAHAE